MSMGHLTTPALDDQILHGSCRFASFDFIPISKVLQTLRYQGWTITLFFDGVTSL
jgi:hypothetical protein